MLHNVDYGRLVFLAGAIDIGTVIDVHNLDLTLFGIDRVDNSVHADTR